MSIKTELCERLGIEFPLVVAPMAGGPTTAQMVAASSNAGVLGSLGAAYYSPEQIEFEIASVRAMTSRPFAVNLFAPPPEVHVPSADLARAIDRTRRYRDELALPNPDLKPPFHPDFEKQFEVILKTKPAVFSFVFGLIDRTLLAECRKQNIYTIGTATTVNEGIALERSGVDAVAAQGVEAGGHRGGFDPDAEDPNIETLDLTRALAARLKIPILAAGGIMDGRGIVAALRAGARAAQMGTAFLLCEEAGTAPPYRRALTSNRIETRLTKVFSGRRARGITNRFMKEMEKHPADILPFPAQNAFTRDLRKKSAELDASDFLSLWAGEGVDQIRQTLSTTQLIRELKAEAVLYF